MPYKADPKYVILTDLLIIYQHATMSISSYENAVKKKWKAWHISIIGANKICEAYIKYGIKSRNASEISIAL